MKFQDYLLQPGESISPCQDYAPKSQVTSKIVDWYFIAGYQVEHATMLLGAAVIQANREHFEGLVAARITAASSRLV